MPTPFLLAPNQTPLPSTTINNGTCNIAFQHSSTTSPKELGNTETTMDFESSTFKISFIIGDILNGKLRPSVPLPILTPKENEQLRKQLTLEINRLGGQMGSESISKRGRLRDRIVESLDREGSSSSRAVDKGKAKAGPEDAKTQFAFTDVTGITMVLNLSNFTDERLLALSGSVMAQLRARNLNLPEDLDLSPSHPIPETVLASSPAKAYHQSHFEAPSEETVPVRRYRSLADDLDAASKAVSSNSETGVFYDLERPSQSLLTNSQHQQDLEEDAESRCFLTVIPAIVFLMLVLGIIFIVGAWK